MALLVKPLDGSTALMRPSDPFRVGEFFYVSTLIGNCVEESRERRQVHARIRVDYAGRLAGWLPRRTRKFTPSWIGRTAWGIPIEERARRD